MKLIEVNSKSRATWFRLILSLLIKLFLCMKEKYRRLLKFIKKLIDNIGDSQMKIKVNKRYIMYFILILIVVLAVPPIILNLTIFSWETNYAMGTLDSWISFFGSYLGSIWGGIIGGIIALLVAKITVKEQYEKEIRKEFLIRKIEQLPSLARAKSELEKIKNELDEVVHMRGRFIHHNDEEYVQKNLYALTFEMKPLNDMNVSHLEKIRDPQIQLSLIDIFDFYKRFTEVYTLNLVHLEEKNNVLVERLRKSSNIDDVQKQQYLERKFYSYKEDRENLLKIFDEEIVEQLKRTYIKIETLIKDIEEETIVLVTA
jgi:hypothetical protein